MENNDFGKQITNEVTKAIEAEKQIRGFLEILGQSNLETAERTLKNSITAENARAYLSALKDIKADLPNMPGAESPVGSQKKELIDNLINYAKNLE